MSFDKKSKIKPETDDLNIRYHLNASLENEGIKVSEDLINRTLEAIKKQEAGGFEAKNEEPEHKKPAALLRKARLLISAAAAVIILLAGMSAIRLLTSTKKADQAIPQYTTTEVSGDTQDAAMKSEAPAKGIKNDEEAKNTKDDQFFAAGGYTGSAAADGYNYGTTDAEGNEIADWTAKDTDDSTMKEAGEENKTAHEQDSSVKLTSVMSRDELSFTDITSIEPADVKSVEINYVMTDKTVTITDEDQLDKFYSVMENHAFIRETEGQADRQIIIDIAGENTASRIVIGSNYIEADTINGDIISHSIYSAADYDGFLEDLKGFQEQ